MKELQVREHLEIKIPEKIISDMDSRSAAVAERLRNGGKPDLTVLALRSAGIVYPAFSVLLNSKLDEPLASPVCGIPLGPEIRSAFARSLEEKDPEIDEALVLDPMNFGNYEKEYMDWLTTGGHEYVRRITDSQKQQSEGLAHSIEKVLLLDDAAGSPPPNTISHTGPMIIRKALGQEVDVVNETMLLNGTWKTEIAKAILGETKFSDAETLFWSELISGAIEVDTMHIALPQIGDAGEREKSLELLKAQGWGDEEMIVPIKTAEHLKLIGKLVLANKGTDPLPGLLTKYGEAELIRFSGEVVEALKKSAEEFLSKEKIGLG